MDIDENSFSYRPERILCSRQSAATPSHWWNGSAFGTYLFDSLSLMLPSVEAFMVEMVEKAEKLLPRHTELAAEMERFKREERSHARAHQVYNAQLKKEGFDVEGLEQALARRLQEMTCRFSFKTLVCIVAAGEHITALIAGAVLGNDRWITAPESRQGKVWRWHAREEMGHARVARDMVSALGISYPRRICVYLMTALFIATDVFRNVRGLYQTDKKRGLVTLPALMKSAFRLGVAAWRDWFRIGRGFLSYFSPLAPQRGTAPDGGDRQTAVGAHPHKDEISTGARFLDPSDVPALIRLENCKWEREQAATEADLVARIEAYPNLSIGRFCPETGEALASLFMKPVSARQLRDAQTWRDCAGASVSPGEAARDLFGISLSSTDPEAVRQVFEFFWPHALKGAWRHIYLGSPVPGLRSWRARHPDLHVQQYVRSSRKGLPCDPQLRYYRGKGFRKIVRVVPNYFPHEESLNYGVLIRGRIPLSSMGWLWKLTPLSLLQRFQKTLFRIL